MIRIITGAMVILAVVVLIGLALDAFRKRG